MEADHHHHHHHHLQPINAPTAGAQAFLIDYPQGERATHPMTDHCERCLASAIARRAHLPRGYRAPHRSR
jgi:hypothetical protein